MGIQNLDLYHGAVFSKIVRASANKISIIEISSEDGSYKLDTDHTTDRQMFIKYRTKSTIVKNSEVEWEFNTLKYLDNSSYALVCIESINANPSNPTMEICYLPPEKFVELFTQDEINSETEISCKVTLKPGCSFRVKRPRKGIELTISRGAIKDI